MFGRCCLLVGVLSMSEPCTTILELLVIVSAMSLRAPLDPCARPLDCGESQYIEVSHGRGTETVGRWCVWSLHIL